jgi:hypothetical protein
MQDGNALKENTAVWNKIEYSTASDYSLFNYQTSYCSEHYNRNFLQ